MLVNGSVAEILSRCLRLSRFLIVSLLGQVVGFLALRAELF